MAVDMELQVAKDAVFELMKEKEKIESALKAMKEVLDCNHVGMNDPLEDSEGFPRQDIDVYQVRYVRHQIISLQNNHKAIMKKIEEGLHKVHALASSNGLETTATTNYSQPTVEKEPFLRVKLVTAGSPAADAGIQVDDLILEFGSIDYNNFRSLQDIGVLVRNSVNKPVYVRIRRGSSVLALTLIPRPWSGEGLLGCNVTPVETVER